MNSLPETPRHHSSAKIDDPGRSSQAPRGHESSWIGHRSLRCSPASSDIAQLLEKSKQIEHSTYMYIQYTYNLHAMYIHDHI